MSSVLRVLFVADSGERIRPLEDELCRGGYRIDGQTVDSAGAARAALEQRPWDVVLCTLFDDGHPALELARWVRDRELDIPLLVVGSAQQEGIAVAALEAGAHDYLLDHVLDRLNHAVRRELRAMAVSRERRHALAALKESEVRFRQLTDNIAEAFWLIDNLNDQVIFVSAACERLWGGPVDALFTGFEAFLQRVHPEDVPLVEGWLADRGWRGIDGEYRVLQPDGDVRWVHTRSIPIPDEGGSIYRYAGVSTDVTQARALEAERKKLSRALEQTADAVIITDRDGIIEYANAAFEDISGYGKEEVIGHTPAMLRSKFQDETFYHQLWESLLNGMPFTDVFINRRKDGELYYEEKTITPVRDDDGNITHFVSTGKDITPRLLAQQRLHRVLHYDALTGLANRILFSDRLQHAVLQTRRLGLAVGVLYIGADLSGLFGEKYGKPVEEKFQMLLAQRLKELVAEGDTVARLGREEFAILHKCGREMQDMEQIARRVTAEFALPMQAQGYELYVSPWIGISRYPDDGESADDLLDHAAIAMRHARDHGPAPFDFYRREMQPGNRRING